MHSHPTVTAVVKLFPSLPSPLVLLIKFPVTIHRSTSCPFDRKPSADPCESA